MTEKELTREILSLSVPERIQLVQDIWDSIAAVPDALDLTEAQKAELDRRLEGLRTNPDRAIPFEDALREIRQNA